MINYEMDVNVQNTFVNVKFSAQFESEITLGSYKKNIIRKFMDEKIKELEIQFEEYIKTI